MKILYDILSISWSFKTSPVIIELVASIGSSESFEYFVILKSNTSESVLFISIV